MVQAVQIAGHDQTLRHLHCQPNSHEKGFNARHDPTILFVLSDPETGTSMQHTQTRRIITRNMYGLQTNHISMTRSLWLDCFFP